MKTAVVTGASGGIGEAVSRQFLDDGYHVVGISRTKPNISEKYFSWVQLDVTKPQDANILSSKIHCDYINVLVHAAGTAFKRSALPLSDDEFYQLFDVNFFAPIYVTNALSPRLQGGVIIPISSTSDRFPEERFALYCSSKAALTMYFDVIAYEHPGIKILVVLPDYVDTSLLRQEVGDEPFDWSAAISSKECASAIGDIVRHKSKFISGSHVILINDKTHFVRNERLFTYHVITKKILER